ncbi:MAG TPA: glycoside hydrolase family 6 protein [Trebonia sp.]|nr:glycoside hydrolase family 6 protein [Trebonia sp.]
MQRRTVRRQLACLTTLALGTAGLALAPGLASAAPAAPAAHTLASNTRFYVPPPAQGSLAQIASLIKSGQLKNAGLVTAMVATPSAVWLDGETPAQAAEPGNEGSQQADADVVKQVRFTLAAARLENAVPVFVAYNIPGRDCSEYSAGGAPTDAAYDAWINAIGSALGTAKAVVLEEPDALGNLPGYCGAAYASSFPDITNTTRIDDIRYAVSTLEADPNISLYLDGSNSAWQNVGGMAQTLVAADVQQSQGFFLNVSNYQYNVNSDYYGTWVSECIAYATSNEAQTPADALAGVATFTGTSTPTGAFAPPAYPATTPPGGCASQYWNGGAPGTNIAGLVGPYTGGALSPYGVWSETSTRADLNTSGIDASYASALGATVPTTHFIVDTSRNALGPDSMQSYAAAPYDQPASVISSLAAGDWCNPPAAGLGVRPTASAGVSVSSLNSYLPSNPALVDAYLWVKTPGQSDGQCDAAGGVRAWDDTADTPSIAGWPSASSAAFQTFDPLWSLATNSDFTDPIAGAWFSQQALSLAQNASPSLP